MSLIRWRPAYRLFPRIWDIQNEINGVFDGQPNLSCQFEDSAWSPSVDIAETADQIVVSADLPGVSKGDIKVNLENNVLTFSGERKRESKAENENYPRTERSCGFFSRSFTLPSSVKVDAIKAGYENGVLRLILPKVEEARPRLIPVGVN